MSPNGFVSLAGPPDFRCCIRFFDEDDNEMKELATDFCNLDAAMVCLRDVTNAWKAPREVMCDAFLSKAFFASSACLEVIDNE